MPLPDGVGRIRLNEDEAQLLLDILSTTRRVTLRARGKARDLGEDVHPYQRHLHYIRKVRDEILLLARQKDWNLHDEFGQSIEEDADPRSAPSDEGGVGERIGAGD